MTKESAVSKGRLSPGIEKEPAIASSRVEKRTKKEGTTNSTTTRRRVSCIKGKLVAVSSLIDQAERSCEDSYAHLSGICTAAGAKVSSHVHRKVFCVIATESAIKQQTQRVRKAWKFGIHVVNVMWLHDGFPVNFEAYTVPSDLRKKHPSASSPTINKTTRVQHDVPDDTKPESKPDLSLPAASEITIDLGCCCVCHDTSSIGTPDCEWCVECPVNRSA